jgi:hypothetical protein
MKNYRRRNMRKTRKGRRASRKGRRASRRQSGGWIVMNPAGVNDTSMVNASKLNLAQGGQYNAAHKGQHGGGAALEGAPVGTTGVLDSSLRSAAHLGPLDKSLTEIQGMSDQSGGGKRRRGRGRRGSRRTMNMRSLTRNLMRMFKKRTMKRKGRKMRGGAALNPADAGAPGTLLPASMANKALMQMNPEWKLAENPASFAPRA